MTNERARTELEQLYMSLSEGKKKALDVAFKAMEQADGEYIPKQAVLENIDQWYEDKADIEDLIVKITYIQGVAIPTTEPKWIPVSERLPEEQGIYLAYIINEYDNRFQYPMTACFSPNKVGCSPQWFPDDETASDNVVAWMPLPKPYEPQESEGNEKNKKRFENELFMVQTNIFPYKGE